MDKVLRYLQRNSDWGEWVDAVHDELVDKIRSNPHLVGIDNPQHSFVEVRLWKGRDRVGCPDLIFIDSDNQMYIIEVHVLHEDRRRPKDARKRLTKQLTKGCNYFRERYGVTAHPVGVYTRVGREEFTSYVPDVTRTNARMPL